MIASRMVGTDISFWVIWQIVAAIPYLQNSGKSRKEMRKAYKYFPLWIEKVARKHRGGCSFAPYKIRIWFTI